MCGIVAAVARGNAVPILIEGLKRLEYRGYDSAGLGLVTPSGLKTLRSIQRVTDLEAQVVAQNAEAKSGIAHTRWATHGIPTVANAHPHTSDKNGRVLSIVHNGIIENHEELRARLLQAGYVFMSETDTEVVAHLIHMYWMQDKTLFDAVQAAVGELRGLYAIAVVDGNDVSRVVGARRGAPLLIGVGDGETFLASDVSALTSVTRKVVYLDEGDVVEIQRDGYSIVDVTGQPACRPMVESQQSAAAVSLGTFEHYMQKEIFEQPEAITKTLGTLLNSKFVSPLLFGADAEIVLPQIEQVLILACGTSYNAGLVARHWLEELADIPVSVEIASEFRYRKSCLRPKTLVVTISQSGETADTLAALQHAKAQSDIETLTICNVPESSLMRASKLRFLTQAGPEIGVASTKAFTTQLTALFILALVLAKVRGKLSSEAESKYIEGLSHLPTSMQSMLSLEVSVVDWAGQFADKQHMLFLGRGAHTPIAMEGALKLKEITYIHAEAYAAGELKHGPLALVDANMPVVAIAPNDQLLEKLKSNLQEVRARHGQLYVFAEQNARIMPAEGMHVIQINTQAGMLSPLLHVVPLQLLAYHVARIRGTDVDKPRNLAKSVTVE